MRAFTLVELIVVMALLVVVISLAAPTLSGFFRGRAVDAEARRLMSLTRLGQSRAASSGVPVILWVDAAQRTYGLEEDSSFTENDTKAVEYTLDSGVNVEVGAADFIGAAMLSSGTVSSSKHITLPAIRFQPDGGVDEGSPESVRLTDRDGGSLWVVLTDNRLNYEISSHARQRVTTKR